MALHVGSPPLSFRHLTVAATAEIKSTLSTPTPSSSSPSFPCNLIGKREGGEEFSLIALSTVRREGEEAMKVKLSLPPSFLRPPSSQEICPPAPAGVSVVISLLLFSLPFVAATAVGSGCCGKTTDGTETEVVADDDAVFPLRASRVSAVSMTDSETSADEDVGVLLPLTLRAAAAAVVAVADPL